LHLPYQLARSSDFIPPFAYNQRETALSRTESLQQKPYTRVALHQNTADVALSR